MQTIEYTPGPWVVKLTKSDLRVVAESGAVIHYIDFGFDNIISAASINARKQWIAADIANARLIAAAPDLLAALEQIARLGEEGDPKQHQLIREALTEIAVKCLAKAKGE